jgi:hypothetical protein
MPRRALGGNRFLGADLFRARRTLEQLDPAASSLPDSMATAVPQYNGRRTSLGLLEGKYALHGALVIRQHETLRAYFFRREYLSLCMN